MFGMCVSVRLSLSVALVPKSILIASVRRCARRGPFTFSYVGGVVANGLMCSEDLVVQVPT